MYEHHLTQGERLEFVPIAPHILDASTLGEPYQDNEPPLTDTLLTNEQWRYITTLSTPSGGFRMPSREAVRMNDARLSVFGGVSTHESEDDDEENDEENALRDAVLDKRRDSLREHSFRLPSQASRRDVTETLRSMGCTYHD